MATSESTDDPGDRTPTQQNNTEQNQRRAEAHTNETIQAITDPAIAPERRPTRNEALISNREEIYFGATHSGLDADEEDNGDDSTPLRKLVAQFLLDELAATYLSRQLQTALATYLSDVIRRMEDVRYMRFVAEARAVVVERALARATSPGGSKLDVKFKGAVGEERIDVLGEALALATQGGPVWVPRPRILRHPRSDKTAQRSKRRARCKKKAVKKMKARKKRFGKRQNPGGKHLKTELR